MRRMRHVVHDVSSILTWTCWGCLGLVWAIGLVNVHRAGAPDRAEKERDLASLAGAAAGLLVLAVPASIWHSLTISRPWLEIAGLMLLLPATAAATWSRLELGSMWSSAARTKQQHRLRTGGPYAVTRHPIYTAIIAMMTGTALTQGFGRWALLLVAITLVLKSKITAEERLLARQFPGQYSRYRERVPQLVPRLLPDQGDRNRRR